MSKTVLLKPRLNEKTYALADKRVYVFDVDRKLNKQTVAKAVESQFEVKVATVNALVHKGKTKRTISLSGKRILYRPGQRSDVKRAYVTLQEGFSLPFFEAIEQEEAKEAKAQAKIDESIQKQADKEEKPKKRLLRRSKKETK